MRQKVWADRYSLKDENGQPVEQSPSQMWRRVARAIADVEKVKDREYWYAQFYEVLKDFKFVPGGRILSGAGTGAGVTYFNCFCLPEPEDSRKGIVHNLGEMIEIMSRGGGVGINFSRLRPKGSYIKTVNGHSSGPVTWMELYSAATGKVIQQGGCFVGSTLVATPKGPVQIRDIQEGDLVYGWKGKVSLFRASKAFLTRRNAEVWKVETDKGLIFYCTPDHKLLKRSVTDEADYFPACDGVDKPVMPFTRYYKERTGWHVSDNNHRIVRATFSHHEDVYDIEVQDAHNFAICDERGQSGVFVSNSRRGALMEMLDDWHPDVEEFITRKAKFVLDESTGLRRPEFLEHANISVCLSDGFMQAVRDDDDWNLEFPEITHPAYAGEWDGDLRDWKAKGYPTKVYKTIKARDLWDLICTSAWKSADPGLVFMERYNKLSNSWYFEKIQTVNPCLAGDTLIASDRGLVRVSDLVADVDLQVSSGDGALTTLPAVAFPTGTKPVYRLQTREGYYLRVTRDHRIMTPGGWRAAGDLQSGETITLAQATGTFGPEGNYDLGLITGWLVGDGVIARANQSARLLFFGDKRCHVARFEEAVRRTVGGTSHREYAIASIVVKERDEERIDSTRLYRQIDPALHVDKLQVPPSVFQGTRDMQVGFLRGLFTSDGTVATDHAKGASVRLTSISRTLLEGVQQLLVNFGIKSRIYANRHRAGERFLPNGHGGLSRYYCQATHDLHISNASLCVFRDEVGFLPGEHQRKLDALLSSYRRQMNRDPMEAHVESLTYERDEMVFDVTEPLYHRLVANGVVVHNCSEQGLGPYSVCLLGSMNLSAYVVDGDSGSTAWFNFPSLIDDVGVAVRMLDNVIDINEYFMPDNEQAEKVDIRRMGLGTMGLADALIRLQIRYGSPEAVELTEKVYQTIRNSAYRASVELARERGSFARFDIDRYLEGEFIKQLPSDIRQAIAACGIRNCFLITQAPTGSTSLIAGVSSGIEPVFDFAFKRVDRTGESIIYHPLLAKWFTDHPTEVESNAPGYFVNAEGVTVEEHVRMQAACQKYNDSSISKTINLPNSATVDDVKNAYALAYFMGLKGITVYRDGSRDAVLYHLDDDRLKKDGPTQLIDHEGTLEGRTSRVTTPVGVAHVTINHNGDDHIAEIFVTVGKAGSDISADSEALGRLLSLIFRIPTNVPYETLVGEIVHQLDGIGGSGSTGLGKKRIRSLADGVAKVLKAYVDKEVVRSYENNSDRTTKFARDICPDCGQATLVHEEGCEKCPCGFSRC